MPSVALKVPVGSVPSSTPSAIRLISLDGEIVREGLRVNQYIPIKKAVRLSPFKRLPPPIFGRRTALLQPIKAHPAGRLAILLLELGLFAYDIYGYWIEGTGGGPNPSAIQPPGGLNPFDPALWEDWGVGVPNPTPPSHYIPNGEPFMIYRQAFPANGSFQSNFLEQYRSPPANWQLGQYPASYEWVYPFLQGVPPTIPEWWTGPAVSRIAGTENINDQGYNGPMQGVGHSQYVPGMTFIGSEVNPNYRRNLAGTSTVPLPSDSAGEPEQRKVVLSEDAPEYLPASYREPPPAGTRERKAMVHGKSLGIAFSRALGAMSEVGDVVNAVYEALPPDVRKRWEKGRGGRWIKDRATGKWKWYLPSRGLADQAGQYGIDGADWKLEAIYHNMHRLDVPLAVQNILENEFSDRLYGAAYGSRDRLRPRRFFERFT